MKLKTLSLIAIALTLSAAPFAVKAQANSSSPLVVAQAPEQGPKKGFWQNLGLTDTQKAQIRTIRQDSRTKMEAVFTPEQKAKLEARFQERRAQREAGQTPQPGERRRKGGWAELNLTEAQKTQIREIRQSEKQQIQAVLTPEQQQKLEQLRQEARSRRQQGDR